MTVKACINGVRTPDQHPALPVTPEQIAAEVLGAEAAGAFAVHLHVKDADGRDTLDAERVATVLAAVRAAGPRVPVGVTTGAWAQPDPAQRVAAIEAWTTAPDFASVNWHEDGADEVARALTERGVVIEAGLWNATAIERWAASPYRDGCVRALVELQDGAQDAERTADELVALVGRNNPADVPVLLHGNGSTAWPLVRQAARLGLQTRIGFEDALTLPDGASAADNAALVRAALDLYAAERG